MSRNSTSRYTPVYWKLYETRTVCGVLMLYQSLGVLIYFIFLYLYFLHDDYMSIKLYLQLCTIYGTAMAKVGSFKSLRWAIISLKTVSTLLFLFVCTVWNAT